MTIWLKDDLGFCSDPAPALTGTVKTPLGEGISNVNMELVDTFNFAPPIFVYNLTDTSGNYHLNDLPLISGIYLAPEKDDNQLNGVTTYDLVLIAKHILGLQPLDSPYKIIAADINKSKAITTFDIVEARKLILGIYTDYPNNTSWRFVTKNYVFPNPDNPFQEAWPDKLKLDLYPTYADADFIGIKIGDVNFSAVPHANAPTQDRNAGLSWFNLPDREVQPGEVFETRFETAESLEAYQFTLSLSGLKALQVIESENVTRDNFNLAPEHAISLSIDGAQTFTLRFQAEKAGRLSEMLRISDDITRAEAYGKNGVRQPMLHFIQPNETKQSLQLYQNYPNPFSEKTSVAFYLPEASDIVFTVYDVLGRVLYSHSDWYESGMQAIELDKTNFPRQSGQGYYTLQAGREIATRKMTW